MNLNADGQLQLYDFLSQQSVEVKVETPIVLSEVQRSLSSHATADYLLMGNFVEAVAVGQTLQFILHLYILQELLNTQQKFRF